MRVRVSFRVDTETGEVEEFLIEDISTDAEADHEAVHDGISMEVGRVLERRPAPEQVVGSEQADGTPLVYAPGQDETVSSVEQIEAEE